MGDLHDAAKFAAKSYVGYHVITFALLVLLGLLVVK